MKMLWCWRCKAEMPMLDDEEYRYVTSLLWKGTESGIVGKRDAAVLDAYERITGLRETNISAIYHHRLSDYGPPCTYCGKPLRTPRAKLCGSCMKPVAASDSQ